MDTKIEIKEEDYLSDNVASEDETELFHEVVTVKTNSDDVLVDVAIKTETPFAEHLIHSETVICSNNWEIDRKTGIEQQTLISDFGAQSEEDFHLENPVMKLGKLNSDHGNYNKIQIKEEPWSLDIATTSVCDDIKITMAERFWRADQLNTEQMGGILAEIPSDEESTASDIESDEDDLSENLNSPVSIQPAISASDCDSGDDIDEDDIDDLSHTSDAVLWMTGISDSQQTGLFIAPSGPNIPEDKESPLDIFHCVYPAELIDHLVYQTNRYASQKLGGSIHFQPTNAEEIKIFLAINMLMGIKKLPSYKDYWSADPSLRDSYISSLMSRNRFAWLLAHLHVNDNSSQPPHGDDNYDKLFKVRPLLNYLSKTFKESYKPSEAQSVDESIIRFKGRSSIKQYMSQRPIKQGYKVWVRANENGFVSQFEIYTGKIADTPEKCLGARFVKTLTGELQGKYHKVYFDNYFTSVQLMKHLKQQGIYACGTVRKGQIGMPSDFGKERDIAKGKFQFRTSNEGLVAILWKDKKEILFLSNFHDTDDGFANRKNKDGGKQQISCLQIVKDYNSHMGYVDKADQMKAFYEIDRKSNKWWLRIFWHFLDVSVVNAFLIFKERSNDAGTLSLKKFRLAVVAGLVGASTSTGKGRKSGKLQNKFKPYIAPERKYDQAEHMPERGTSRRCAYCSTAANPHRTKWFCKTCEVGLCMLATKNCFQKFHKR